MSKIELAQQGTDVFIGSPVSIIRPGLISVGDHVAIDPFVHITTGAELGSYVHISAHVGVIGGKTGLLKMEDFTNLSLGARVICGSDEFKGAGIVSVPGLPDEMRDDLTIEPVTLERFANTGAGATLLPGVTLPEGVVIGACSLVRKKDKLEPWTIYAGNPLRRIEDRPRHRILRHARKLGY